jgi:hypothetical protein
MAVWVTTGFVLKCKQCAHEFTVGCTARHPRSERTFYFDPDARMYSWEMVVGVSDGKGDSFVCSDCAAEELKSVKESE